MRKNKRYQKETFCCSECGKNQSKYREFIGAYLCNACYSKLNIKELENIEKNNYILFEKNDSEKNIMNQEENKIKVGSTIFVEQAWEDNRGNYHDEYAEVLSIDAKGFMKLKFPTEEITKLLDGAEYNIKDYQDCVN